MTLIVQIGLIVIFVGSLVLLYRFVQFLLIALFGQNFSLTYIDKDGAIRTKRIRIGKDHELAKLLADVKASTKNKKNGVNS